MRYRVSYRKRFNAEAKESDSPAELLDVGEGVILDAKAVEQTEPPSIHTGETMEEDDDFLAFGSEVWEYDVVPGREGEFEAAVQNSAVVLEVLALDDEGEVSYGNSGISI